VRDQGEEGLGTVSNIMGSTGPEGPCPFISPVSPDERESGGKGKEDLREEWQERRSEECKKFFEIVRSADPWGTCRGRRGERVRGEWRVSGGWWTFEQTRWGIWSRGASAEGLGHETR
jgi:hypothetical protein